MYTKSNGNEGLKRGIKINKICNNYKAYIRNCIKKSTLDKLLIIGYGSNIYMEEKNSDFDVCIIDYSGILTIEETSLLTDLTLNFHKENGLKIDEEVPFSNKLIFNKQEISQIFNKNPFINENGIFEINDVIKTNEFLSSPEMKKRLFLNIFTTDRLVISGNIFIEKVFEFYSWKIVIEAITHKYMLNDLNYEVVEKLLYSNPYTSKEGEWYLGYKKNNIYKERYITEGVKKFCSQFYYSVMQYD
ncbi:hypothetical protein CN300_10430 [Bacillus thuringiensis]|uniref:hypothetical protein n=1 Tax=Bacillus cereus group TaxID=86661 RepID=UPI0007B6DFC0|nr:MULTISPECIES: hypothetical protein [Bacillus cereus group]ANC23017.1 hypothetical protein WR52_30385 [Bacillus cereus]PEC17496.1 hypothetical protein CON19_07075 [Bacillus thuringiensis]PEV14646.1 hypothetical protein CN418_15120 [Bacillus thuringiensis]PEY72812.1 hypothetical protein CN355_12630 [Bacillus thuringiensis]PFC45708.1 hypothetical protein CN300_10430 [Bacillus thuringiensis]